MTADLEQKQGLGRMRSKMSRAELYAEIDELQQTVLLAVHRLSTTEARLAQAEELVTSCREEMRGILRGYIGDQKKRLSLQAACLRIGAFLKENGE